MCSSDRQDAQVVWYPARCYDWHVVGVPHHPAVEYGLVQSRARVRSMTHSITFAAVSVRSVDHRCHTRLPCGQSTLRRAANVAAQNSDYCTTVVACYKKND
jgi:hypothetical protein